MKFKLYVHKTVLFIAIEQGNIDIVKLLLSNDKIDINQINISTYHQFTKFENKPFYCI